ncbi:MAG: NAD(P)H-hydrate dehydratase [Synergistaceae bacterium]|nr:NAD(P)H-hydrate dehydratase [Synergistaceae bacterium]
MKNFFMPADIREADNIAASKYGIPSVVLMENAAKNAARAAVTLSGGPKGSFVVLAGRGNNGGDGFAVARHLLIGGAEVTVLKSDADEIYKNDAAVNLEILRRLGGKRLRIFDTPELTDSEISALLGRACCVIEGLLGTGTSGAPRKEPARLIRLLEGCKNVLALDVPSGIDPESGGVYEPCVRAAETVTFLAPKYGMAFQPAADNCGNIITADIGVPPEAILPEKHKLSLYESRDLHSMLPEISRNIHKTERGNVLVYAGSGSYRGAPLLTVRGALRAGAGLVFAAVPDFIAPHISAEIPEAIVLPLATRNGEVESASSAAVISEWLPKCAALVAGPGCGRSEGAGELFLWLWKTCRLPLLLDADMLWFYARNLPELTPRADVLLTPHSAEAGRILGLAPAEVDSKRAECAFALAAKAGQALLKGRNTLIAFSEELRMIAAGSPSLAVPGSGDVLSGVIGAFIAAGIPIADAATAGALAHGLAGEALEARLGVRGALAREIADEIPAILR